MKKCCQAKDIPSVDAMKVLLAAREPRLKSLTEAYPNLPHKVCHAKYKQLLKSGLIDGCACGCCTVAEITEKGKALVVREVTQEIESALLNGAETGKPVGLLG